MTQSANARPCNCPQALEAEGIVKRARAAFATWRERGGIEGPVDTLDSIGVALAGQPEAHACKCAGCRNGFLAYCEVLDGRREAPKDQTEADEWPPCTAQCLVCDTEVLEDHDCWTPLKTKLTSVERILCDLVGAPSLSVAQFTDPTLERIRLAMLGREG